MRTRFLAIDYFSPGSPAETLPDLRLLFLPASHLSSIPPGPLDGRHFFSRSDLDLPVSSEIGPFPFEGALSEFLSDVVPRAHFPSIDAITNGGQCEQSASQGGKPDAEANEILDGFLYDDNGVEEYSHCRSVSPQAEMREGRKLRKEFQFEVVELDSTLIACVNSSQVCETTLCLEIPNIEIPMGIIRSEACEAISYPCEVAKSICSVEDIPDLSCVDQNHISVHDGGCTPDRMPYHTMKLLPFEVTEIGSEIVSSFSMKDAFKNLLLNIEPWPCADADDLVVNVKDIPGSCSIDSEPLSQCGPSGHCFENKHLSLNSLLDVDPINFNDIILLEKNSAIFMITSDGECSHPCSISYQEVELLDLSSHPFQLVVNQPITKVHDFPDPMLKEDTEPTGNFYESVVSSDLVLVDSSFKSLPTPILGDDIAVKPFSLIVGAILHDVGPHLLSSSDGIYLDWHPLLEGQCNREICSSYLNMLEEISSLSETSELQFHGEEMIFTELDFLDDPPDGANMLQRKEVPTMLLVPQASDPTGNPAVQKMLKDGTKDNKNDEQMTDLNKEKVSVLLETMSQSNDLNFFLDVRRGIADRSRKDVTMKASGSKVASIICMEEISVPVVPRKDSPEQWDIVVHQFNLSDHILSLINDIQKTYLTIVENCTELRRSTLFPDVSNFEYLGLSREKVLKLITERIMSVSSFNDETFIPYIALYAVKQLACFLCFYGVHTAYLYLSNLTISMSNLAEKLKPLESLIEDTYRKAEKRLIESHPALSLIEQILLSTAQTASKILIVAERIFWFPLSLKLTCLRIKFHELKPDRTLADQLDNLDSSELTNSILEALAHSDCLLISQQYVSASFPFSKFNIILEYGGPYASPKISSISPNLHGLPRVHFLKINMEAHSHLKALCEDCYVDQHLRSGPELVPPYKLRLHERLDMHHLIGLLNFVPTEQRNSCKSSESANIVDASYDRKPTMSIDHSAERKSTSSSAHSIPEVVIIVNTQNFEKTMLISRRSSYQKVLSMEKGGVQIVEREINLPLDLIFSAAVCLIWYEASKIGDNNATTVETSAVPMFMENIATNILMSLSFSFSGCIMIFEGESNFLAAIMESSDALYAAAASLDMNLQLFCSYMPQSTDEIIMNCIKNARRSDKGLFPPMPESETLGESFLTRFPSINPLSAHAILSSGGMLVEFLEWSHELRIQALEKYHIPEESIYLFSALCRYGEVGESKSVVTECSSIDSDISSEKVQSQRKRQKLFDIPLDNSLYVEPLCWSGDDNIEHTRSSLPHLPKFLNFKGVQRKTERHELPFNDAVVGINWGLNTSTTNNLNQSVRNRCKLFNEDFSIESNEDNSDHGFILFDENISNIPNVINSLRKPELTGAPVFGRSLSSYRSAVDGSGHRTFPSSAEVNSDMNEWTSQKIFNQNSEEKFGGWSAVCSKRDSSPVRSLENLKRNLMQECELNVHRQSVQEKVLPFNDKDLFPNVFRSSKLQRDPHSASEFINNLKEKRKMHEKALPCNICLSCPGSLVSKNKYSRTQSPSLIESYRYQGGNQVKKTMRQKASKRVKVQVNMNREKDPSLISPTWTPVDKRARQNLSFTRNGNEKQSKLVWRSSNSPSIGFNLKRRYRDEG